MITGAWVFCVYWTVASHHEDGLPEHEAILLDRWDRLTRDECWQLRNFGVIRDDFMGWVIDRTVEGLLK